jgi:hypothetical protein
MGSIESSSLDSVESLSSSLADIERVIMNEIIYIQLFKWSLTVLSSRN